ncbi:hypothetical protein D3C80_1797010 [compost metagenome]
MLGQFGAGQQLQVGEHRVGLGLGLEQGEQVGVRPQRRGAQVRLENRLVFGVHEGYRDGTHFQQGVFVGFCLLRGDGETDL